eukprot:TRINITY_DN44367_c0_g1_i1.p1 TRINITY_DN44367_c0_g1~~TRINITY_DN44367_c0_g1_i1.p1  ORF type:complete len:211 (-),score=16.08 TRINITY_DN44367_c0_g1_i1:489-1121(-)
MFVLRWSPSRQEWNRVCIPLPSEVTCAPEEHLTLPTTERPMIASCPAPPHLAPVLPQYRLVQTPLGLSPQPHFPGCLEVPPVYHAPTVGSAWASASKGSTAVPHGPAPPGVAHAGAAVPGAQARLSYQSHPVYDMISTPLGPQFVLRRSIDVVRHPPFDAWTPPTFFEATNGRYVFPPSWVEEAVAKQQAAAAAGASAETATAPEGAPTA